MCTKNHNHVVYSSWDSEWDRQTFLSLCTLFCPFTSPLIILNIKILKKWKKCLEILSFYTYMCTVNEGHIILLYIHVYHKSRSWHMVPEIQGATEQKLSTFWAIFCPLNPLRTWKIKILTLKKTPGDIIILHICTTTGNHMIYGAWHM